MKKEGKGLIGIILISIIVLLIITCSTIFSHYCKAVDLEQRIDAQFTTNKSNYDNMWKKFKEMTQVTDVQAKQMKDIYTGLIQGRYNDPKVLFKMVKESNPQVNTNLYVELQREISAGRNSFDNHQKQITDIIREYNSYVKKHFVMAAITHRQVKKMDDYITTSDRTQKAFDNHKDEEINLTGKTK